MAFSRGGGKKEEETPMDHRHMTAPCGLPCFECYLYLANEDQEIQAMAAQHLDIPLEKALCQGCRNHEGQIPHIPMPCRVYPCAAAKGVDFCCDCPDFPCDFLHPYMDRCAVVWHNTKVFNLCLIKKMGLEAWARNKARSVRDVFISGQWRL
jgi:hypothetical protein